MKNKRLFLVMILTIVLVPACTPIRRPPNPDRVTTPAIQAPANQDLSGLTPETCLNNTRDNPHCKDCCDCLPGLDANTIKTCRDTCANHDFGQNSATLNFTAPSEQGPQGDYSLFTAPGSQQECKRLCDSSTVLACGDRRFCRDACNKLSD